MAAGSNPITIAVGDELEELTIKSGRVYKDVIIRKIKKTGVTIIHSSGARTIPANELPDYAFLFDRIDEPENSIAPPAEEGEVDNTDENAASKKAINRWVPESIDDVKDVCVVVRITKQIAEDGSALSDEKGVLLGSGFLCNVGQTTYIYSSANYFCGAKEFKIEYANGKEIDPRQFVDVQVASGKAGYCKKSNLGSDVLRIRLRSFHPKALNLDGSFLSEEADLSRSVSVIGVRDGGGSLAQYTGSLHSIHSYDVFAHSASPDMACNGGPIVDNQTYKLIGIQTWRQRPTNPLEVIWGQRGRKNNLKWSPGVSLTRMQYTRSSFDRLYEDRLILSKMITNIRLLGLMNAIEPHKDGILLNTSRQVMGIYSIRELLESHSDHYIVKSLESLDAKLRRDGSNLGMSNHDVWKAYRTAYRGGLKYSARLRSEISNTSHHRSKTFRDQLEKLELLEVCQAYERWIAKSLSWFERQLGTSGDALPLGQPGLPSIQDSLAALAIKADYINGSTVYVTEIDEDNDNILKLTNGGIVKITGGYLGHIGYRENAVLFEDGYSWKIWIEGKETFSCELVKAANTLSGSNGEKISIHEVKEDGKILTTLTGSSYEVSDLDTIVTALWIGHFEALLIDGTRLLNLDKGSKIINVTQLR